MATVVFASDSHLSGRAPQARANWDTVVDYVAGANPALVIHLGDLTLDGPDDPSGLTDARGLLDALPAPWLAVPGNHDIGDNPWPGQPGDATVDADRLERWRSAIGMDWWTADLDGWTLIALDAQLFDSSLDAEQEQWAWLADIIGATSPHTPIVVVSHKPLAATDAELLAAPPYRFVSPVARDRLRQLLADRLVPLVVSGHVHQSRDLVLHGRRHVWAPSTWAVLPDDIQPRLGTKRCGVLRVDLAPDGRVDATIVEPPGIAHPTLTHDIPDPYQR